VEAVVTDLDSLLWVQRTVDNLSVVVQAGGELDMLTAPRLSAQLDQAEAIVVPPAPVVLDLTALTFLGSAGLVRAADAPRTLRRARQHAADQGRRPRGDPTADHVGTRSGVERRTGARDDRALAVFVGGAT